MGVRISLRLPAPFECELYLALAGLRRRRQLAGVWNHVAVTVEDLHLWRLKVGAVEQIERLDPELQPRTVAQHRPVLEQGRIDIQQARTAQRVSSQVSQLPQCWKGEALRPDVVERVAGIDGVGRAAWRGV